MDKDQVVDVTQQFAGKLQSRIGDLSGDAKTAADGAARQSFGQAQESLGNLKATAAETMETLQEQVRESPLTAVLVAAILGWVIGRVTN